MNAKFNKIGGAALVVALIGAGTLYYRHHSFGQYQQETNDATIQADQVAISSKLAGYVRKVAVTENQSVGHNGLLVEIDPVDFANRIHAADASIASAFAGARAVEASQAEAAAEIGRIHATMRASQASLDHANRELARYRPLVAQGAEPAAMLSQLTVNRERAAAEVAAQHAALVQAGRRVQSVGAQTGQFAAQVAAARVQRAAAANDVAATRLKSPINGRVANRSVRVGQFVQPGMRLMTIVPTKDIYVVANFKETQVGLMRPGQRAAIQVDALPGVEFNGRIESITPGTGSTFSMIPPQNATGNFTKVVQRVPVRIRIDAGPASRKVLVPGLSLAVEVDTRSSKHELAVIEAEQQGFGAKPQLALRPEKARQGR